MIRCHPARMGQFCVAAALALLVGLVGPPVTAAGPLKVATWNIEHLMAGAGTGCKPRTAEDYARLRRYADRLDADVIALQEVENVAAARRVFDADAYAVELFRRHGDSRGECHRRSGQLYGPLHTGFAIRDDVNYERHPDVRELERGGRRGVDIGVSMNGETLRLLSVHLHGGCFTDDHNARGEPECEPLGEQIGIIGEWLDERTREGRPAAMLGDFNRRLTLPGDRLWARLSDGDPAHYTNLTDGHRQRCRGPYEGMPYIDHIIVNPEVEPYVASDLLPLVYDEPFPGAPSDHCPIAVLMERAAPH